MPRASVGRTAGPPGACWRYRFVPAELPTSTFTIGFSFGCRLELVGADRCRAFSSPRPADPARATLGRAALVTGDRVPFRSGALRHRVDGREGAAVYETIVEVVTAPVAGATPSRRPPRIG